MSTRTTIGKQVESALGKERADRLRKAERSYRKALADKIAPAPAKKAKAKGAAPAAPAAKTVARRPLGEPNDRQGGWQPSDPFVEHPKPTHTRHDLLRGLHERLRPRTYLEVGVNAGQSLTLSRAKSIGVDPEFSVTKPLHCDLDLVQAKSDEFFARPDALAHFEGVPVDLAFLDGMHLSEFALRDFINVERHLAATGVAVFDDVMPRNALEAARVRLTGAWAGDIYKAVEIVARRRPDLVVLLVNTWPTGTAVVVGTDAASTVLQDAYESEVPYLEADDPQTPPLAYMNRSIAVDPAALLESEAWDLLVTARETGDQALVEKAKDVLRAIPKLG